MYICPYIQGFVYRAKSTPRGQFAEAARNWLVFRRRFSAMHTCLYMWGAKYETFVAGLVSGEGSQLIRLQTWFMLCYSKICSVYAVSLV